MKRYRVQEKDNTREITKREQERQGARETGSKRDRECK